MFLKANRKRLEKTIKNLKKYITCYWVYCKNEYVSKNQASF
ncbi:18277_t:CDS:2 [Dentiscutata erythropus]|uniref:18277_t:CDS:1 n=1 Tax=Dentiscutata erythropus TaxID=1348616 RepID=A0A9N9BHW1_9GLOM|nr:18277_t:CDS:2 [Dentiscutata erythropus]